MTARIMILIAALVPMVGCSQPRSSRDAVGAVERLGGQVTFDESSAERPVIGVTLAVPGITEDALWVLEAFPQLRSLCLSNCKIGDNGVARVKTLSKLKQL